MKKKYFYRVEAEGCEYSGIVSLLEEDLDSLQDVWENVCYKHRLSNYDSYRFLALSLLN